MCIRDRHTTKVIEEDSKKEKMRIKDLDEIIMETENAIEARKSEIAEDSRFVDKLRTNLIGKTDDYRLGVLGEKLQRLKEKKIAIPPPKTKKEYLKKYKYEDYLDNAEEVSRYVTYAAGKIMDKLRADKII